MGVEKCGKEGESDPSANTYKIDKESKEGSWIVGAKIHSQAWVWGGLLERISDTERVLVGYPFCKEGLETRLPLALRTTFGIVTTHNYITSRDSTRPIMASLLYINKSMNNLITSI